MFPIKDKQRRKISILGGSGFIGKELISKLSKQNFLIRVLTKNKINTRSLWPIPNTEFIEYINTEESIRNAIGESNFIVNLVGQLQCKKSYPWGKEFDDAHVKLVQNLVSATNGTECKKIVHISALGVTKNSPSMYLRSKMEGERNLSKSSLEIVILRPSVVFGPGDSFLNLFSKMHRILPFIPLASPNSMFQPIYVRDLVEIIHECINRDPKTKKSVFECVGPEIFSLYELVSLAGKYSGKSKMIIPLSKNLGLLQAFFMEMLPGKPLLSRDNLLSASIPNIATNDQELVYQLENFQNIHSIAPKYL